MRSAFAIGFWIMILAQPVLSQTFGPDYFGDPGACYGRIYDKAHLQSHPVQQVVEIGLVTQEPFNGFDTLVRLTAVTRSSPEVYLGYAICRISKTGLSCFMEGDAGSFLLGPADNGGVRLEVFPETVVLEGAQDFIELSAVTGDDKVFLLSPVGPCP